MAKICPVCNEKIKFSDDYNMRRAGLGKPDFEIHFLCESDFDSNPELYGGITNKAEKETKLEKEQNQKILKEKAEQIRKEREEKSVYIKGGVDVKGFSMPFGEMVVFMVKWAIASIPAFIILAIIGAIFFAIFGALFF